MCVFVCVGSDVVYNKFVVSFEQGKCVCNRQKRRVC